MINAKQLSNTFKKIRQFSFDAIFEEETTNDKIFKSEIKPMTTHILNGFNASIFAYGMTGAGKTYTMFGDLHKESDFSNPGIILQSASDLLERLKKTDKHTVKLSYLEIYNE